MPRFIPYALFILFVFQIPQVVSAQMNNWWQGIGSQSPTLLRSQEVNIASQKAFYLAVNLPQLQNLLSANQEQSFALELPDPRGQKWVFTLETYQIMEAGLQTKYPAIRTYQGHAQGDPTYRIHLTITSDAWFAAVSNGIQTWYIDPYTRPFAATYQVYYKSDCTEDRAPRCQIERSQVNEGIELRAENEKIEGRLKIFRLAVSASYSYFDYFGGTIEGTIAAIINTVNRVNMVYERDLAVRLVLVANNDSLIVTDPASEMFTVSSLEGAENQRFIDEQIGSENYDIGHVFDRGSGGYGELGVVCDNNQKAIGYTGLQRPQGDVFDIDFVAHEIGHQFAANHTFNGLSGTCGSQRTLTTSFEPGSGTTIMSYAGICGLDDFVPNANDYFHGGSIVEMNGFLTNGSGRLCGETITVQNQAPEITFFPDLKFLPVLTPFELSAEVSDPDGDLLSFNWEQIDPGVGAALGAYDIGDGPLFRSFPSVGTAYRSFPNMEDLLANNTTRTELLPNNSRELNFQLTVRDLYANGGGVAWDRVKYFVDEAAGPFRLENPGTLLAGSNVVFRWDVANTHLDPVGVDSVDLFLSTDGGLNFDQHLRRVLNDGFAVFFIPEGLNTSSARFKLKAVDHIFFDVSDLNNQIRPAENNEAFIELIGAQNILPACAQDSILVPFFYNFFSPSDSVQIGVNANLSGFNGSIEPIEDNRFNLILLGGDLLNTDIYPVQLVINLGEEARDTLNFAVDLVGADAVLSTTQILPIVADINVSIQPNFAWEGNELADFYQVELSQDALFQNILFTSPLLEDVEWQLPQVLESETTYFWRVSAINQRCGLTNFSTVQEFTTENIVCKVFTATDLPVAFNSFPFIQSSINVEEDAILVDVNVLNVSGTYDRPGGIDFRLRSPEGPVLTLLGRQNDCTQGERFSFSLDDDRGLLQVPCPNDQEQTLEPDNPLSIFNGQNAQGRWTLSIFDNNGDGALEAWSLELCFGGSSVVNTTNTAELSNLAIQVFPNPIQDRVTFQSQGVTIYSIQLFNVRGQLVQSLQNQEAMQVDVPVAQLVPGVYFYQVMLENGRWQRGKLVK